MAKIGQKAWTSNKLEISKKEATQFPKADCVLIQYKQNFFNNFSYKNTVFGAW